MKPLPQADVVLLVCTFRWQSQALSLTSLWGRPMRRDNNFYISAAGVHSARLSFCHSLLLYFLLQAFRNSGVGMPTPPPNRLAYLPYAYAAAARRLPRSRLLHPPRQRHLAILLNHFLQNTIV